MTAPFELLDRANIHTPWNSATPIHVLVPCRIVPSFVRGFNVFALNFNTTYTHWIDLNGIADLRDGYTYAPGGSPVTFTPTTVFRAEVIGVVQQYLVIFLERRFTNTTREYMRAYCRRVALVT